MCEVKGLVKYVNIVCIYNKSVQLARKVYKNLDCFGVQFMPKINTLKCRSHSLLEI